MKPYFAYIRVSTVRQGQGVSLQEQRDAIAAHAQRCGLTIVEWFEEKETAVKEGRNVFSAMIARLERGAAKGVIIHKIDRGARNLSDWANLGKLFDRGIDVQFAHDSIDLSSRGGRLSADIMAVVAADYVRNLRDEVKKGFYGRLKQGLYPLPAPIGYLDNGGGKLKTIDPVAGPLMRWAFETYAKGTIGLDDLAAELTRRGLRPRYRGRVSVQTLSQAFHNPFYIGIIRIARTKETFPGIHEPLVTQQMFERVQAVLAGKAPHKAQFQDFSFRRFIRCAQCDRHLSGERKKGRYIYYRCLNARCRGSVLREEEVCAALRAEANLVQLAPRELKDLKDIARDQLADTAKATEEGLVHLRLQLARQDERLHRLTDAVVDSLIDKEEFEARKLVLLQKRRDLQDRLENPDGLRIPEETVLEYLELPEIQQLSHETANPQKLRKIGEAITWNFYVSGKKPVIRLRNPFLAIKNWRLSYRVDRIGEQLELSRLHAELKAAAVNDNDPLQCPLSPSSPELPPAQCEHGRH